MSLSIYFTHILNRRAVFSNGRLKIFPKETKDINTVMKEKVKNFLVSEFLFYKQGTKQKNTIREKNHRAQKLKIFEKDLFYCEKILNLKFPYVESVRMYIKDHHNNAYVYQ